MSLREGSFLITKKPWGEECLVTRNQKYALKKIQMKAGTRSSLQSHSFKLETIFVVEGLIELETDLGGRIVKEKFSSNEAYTVPVGAKHRVLVLEDCLLFEVSTPELEDVVRYEDDFGRVSL